MSAVATSAACMEVTGVTSGSSLPRAAEASSCHVIARRGALTVAHLRTSAPVGALFTH